MASGLAVVAVEANTCLLGVCVTPSGTPSGSLSPSPVASAISAVASPISSAVSGVASQVSGLLSPVAGSVSSTPGPGDPGAGSDNPSSTAGGSGGGDAAQNGGPGAAAGLSGGPGSPGGHGVGAASADRARVAALNLTSPASGFGLGSAPVGWGGLMALWPLFLGLDAAGLCFLAVLVRRTWRRAA